MIKIIFLFFILSFNIAHGATIGERFHEETKHTWVQVLKDVLTPKPPKPPPFKEYKGEKINLPKPDFKGLFLEDAIIQRLSIRKYTARPLTLTELS